MDIRINSKEDLIEFVNRPDVSIEDALKVAKKCFSKKTIVFINRETGEVTYSKSDIIKKIKEDETKHIWIM